jgi:hypothetical protein
MVVKTLGGCGLGFPGAAGAERVTLDAEPSAAHRPDQDAHSAPDAAEFEVDVHVPCAPYPRTGAGDEVGGGTASASEVADEPPIASARWAITSPAAAA